MHVVASPAPPSVGFRHEALMYAGDEAFIDAITPFVLDGIELGEPILAALSPSKITALRDALGRDADAMTFADITELGHNPARIIPAWREYVDFGPAAGKRRRGIGEPIWAGRSEVEVIECQRNEALLNIAFDSGADWWLLCPYDTETLEPAIIREAERSHPHLLIEGAHRPSPLAAPEEEMAAVHLSSPLSAPPPTSWAMYYGSGNLRAVREYVSERVIATGLDSVRAFDLLVAVSEIATNSVQHGGGSGQLRVWSDSETLVCEFSDDGLLADPLAGRQEPPVDAEGMRGLWLANQLCDLVQIRVFESGTVIRLHMQIAGS